MAWHHGSWWPVVVPQWYLPRVSQHPLDPYSLIHLLHGVIFHLLWVLVLRLDMLQGLVTVSLLELGWEVAENTEAVIELYRRNSGTSADYQGRSCTSLVVILCSIYYSP